MKRLAIFASGSGTNAERIIRYFDKHPNIGVELVLSNKKDAYVLERAKKLSIPTKVFTREEFAESKGIVDLLKSKKIDLLVLAGFLWLVPSNIIQAFPNAIVNIHPALLPKYGGKNMYGARVHQAVIRAHEKESGITIHLVDEVYDNGRIVFQAKCQLSELDTPETLAEKIHTLEYEHFPRVIENLLSQPKPGADSI
jgi:phosphoribosylglycinamide formyltransferase-1